MMFSYNIPNMSDPKENQVIAENSDHRINENVHEYI